MNKLFIPMILGTNRDGRQSEKVANFLMKVLEERDDIETKLFDVRDFKLPDVDYGQNIKDQFPEYRDAILRADGLIIVAPEYNKGYPGRLKSVLDVLLPEYNHRAVGLVGVSAGPWGGTRVVEALLPVMRELGLVAISSSLYFPNVGKIFKEDGTPVDEGINKRVEIFLKELIFIAKSLKYGRENLE